MVDDNHVWNLPLPARALRWVEETVGSGARVTSTSRLVGGTATAVHAVTVTNQVGVRHDVVLKRFVRAQWVEEQPDIIEREARALQATVGIRLPTPELVGVDAEGNTCDVPALLMTRLPGEVMLPVDAGSSWLRRLVEPLVVLHAANADPSGELPAHQPHNDLERLEVPSWARDHRVWERLLDVVRREPPHADRLFVHRDYHPTNVLWADDRVSGIVDWTNACRGPRGVDLGHCRLNLASLYGPDVADLFLEHYIQLTRYHWEPYWDLLSVTDCLPDPGVYDGWIHLGRGDLTVAIVRQRVEDYTARVLSHL